MHVTHHFCGDPRCSGAHSRFLLDFQGIADIAALTDDEQMTDNLGQLRLYRGGLYTQAVITEEWTLADEWFDLSGGLILPEEYRGGGVETFRSYDFLGEKGVFEKAGLDDVPLLEPLRAMGALSDGNEIRHKTIELLFVGNYAARQVILLSQDGDGITHIAALTHNWDNDTFFDPDLIRLLNRKSPGLDALGRLHPLHDHFGHLFGVSGLGIVQHAKNAGFPLAKISGPYSIGHRISFSSLGV